MLVEDSRDPAAEVDTARIDAAVAALCPGPGPLTLPGGSVITREPGGQVELSSAPGDSLTDCAETTLSDLDALRSVFAARELRLVGVGSSLGAAACPRCSANPATRPWPSSSAGPDRGATS